MTNEVKVTNIKSLIITISLLLLIVTAGTFAWLSYRSKDTKMVLTIGDINNIQITLKPYQLDLELSPVLSYTSLDTNNEYVTVTVTNNSTSEQYYSLYYDISEIDSSLQSNSFKYTILKSTDNGTTYTEDVTGNFSNANTTDNFYILEEVSIPANTTYTYKVYTWVDGNDAPNIENAVFKADLQAELYGSTLPARILYDTIASTAVMDNAPSTYVTNSNGIQFNAISSDTNGKGVYIRTGTENNTYPIYYYRGAVDNNNVLFGGLCWKIVRTTDTGGIKLIYNVTPAAVSIDRSEYNYTNDSHYPFTYDVESKTWTSSMTYQDTDSTSSFTFSVKQTGDYVLKYDTYDISSDMASFDVTKNGNYLFSKNGSADSGNLQLENLSTSDTITITIEIGENADMYSGNPDFLFSLATIQENNECNNVGESSQLASTTAFNTNNSSPAGLGYMYGTTYVVSGKSLRSKNTSYLYGNRFTYSGGTYTLVDTITGTGTWSSDYNMLNNNHYTCLNTTGICESIYYIYNTTQSYGYYITLTGGKSVSDALDEMLTNSSNSTNSTIKTVIDNWYSKNMTSYTSYLEDTIYCNDRSISSLGGWNPNGGSTTSDCRLFFSIGNRIYTTYTPSLTCSKNDSFTVNESPTGNGKLTYPVGLLTSDEVMLAGGKSGVANSTYYLYTGRDYWISSSSRYLNDYADGLVVDSTGGLSTNAVYIDYGARPVVSLKPGTQISGGSGTVSDPYIVN